MSAGRGYFNFRVHGSFFGDTDSGENCAIFFAKAS